MCFSIATACHSSCANPSDTVHRERLSRAIFADNITILALSIIALVCLALPATIVPLAVGLTLTGFALLSFIIMKIAEKSLKSTF